MISTLFKHEQQDTHLHTHTNWKEKSIENNKEWYCSLFYIYYECQLNESRKLPLFISNGFSYNYKLKMGCFHKRFCFYLFRIILGHVHLYASDY